MRLLGSVVLGIFLWTCTLELQATHIRALEITAQRVSGSNLTFLFTITGYRDTEGVNFGQGEFDFGDGSVAEEVAWTLVENIGNDTEKWQFTLTHTYSSIGSYVVSYRESFRNNNVINMNNSGGTDFYTETRIIIDPLIGVNSTPVLTIPPVDLAGSSLIFIHNPGAFDRDGDSLSYRFSIPQKDRGENVNGYLNPNNPAFYTDFNFNQANQAQDGPPTFTLDSLSGDLIWDAPGAPGEYNVAFIVEEWRQIGGVFIRIGFVKRDMQIIVEETDNERPELEIPDDICVVAGDTVTAVAIGTDPDGHPVTLEAFGGPFDESLVNPVATFSPDPPTPQASPGILDFEWKTDCPLIRERPYEVRFKVEDNPPLDGEGNPTAPKLVDFQTWSIKVVGPPPTGLNVDSVNNRMDLNWDQYSCSNADTIEVYRRVDRFMLPEDSCATGIPENAGYELIKKLPATATTYSDNNNGQGLAPGALYCYRLVATFPSPAGGESLPSAEACAEIIADAPIITKVDVTNTDAESGAIRVEWVDPLAPEILAQGPFTYDLLRVTGQATSGDFTSLATGLSDPFFDDTGLNTDLDAYTYKVVLINNLGAIVDTSFAASAVRLELQPEIGAMRVNWSASVPWSNTLEGRPHRVYRDHVNPANDEELVLIDSVNVVEAGFTYFDDGSFNGTELDDEISYCYFVTTQGSYGNDDLPAPLLNNSQIQCAQPSDSIPPCTPTGFSFAVDPGFRCQQLFADPDVCDFSFFENELNWSLDLSPECQDDISQFNIYFSPTSLEADYFLLTSTTATTFTHLDLDSFKGCYRISAVDRSGNESELSEPICSENCPRFELPNAFSPNGDGINDLFTPYTLSENVERCPLFVASLVFTVFDRTGKRLFTYNSEENENDISINWDGRTDRGQLLPAGTYFYSAEVVFNANDPDVREQIFKGWLQLLR